MARVTNRRPHATPGGHHFPDKPECSTSPAAATGAKNDIHNNADRIITSKFIRDCDRASTLTAHLADTLAQKARRERTAQASRLATDALQIACLMHLLTHDLWVAESEARAWQ